MRFWSSGWKEWGCVCWIDLVDLKDGKVIFGSLVVGEIVEDFLWEGWRVMMMDRWKGGKGIMG